MKFRFIQYKTFFFNYQIEIKKLELKNNYFIKKILLLQFGKMLEFWIL